MKTLALTLVILALASADGDNHHHDHDHHGHEPAKHAAHGAHHAQHAAHGTHHAQPQPQHAQHAHHAAKPIVKSVKPVKPVKPIKPVHHAVHHGQRPVQRPLRPLVPLVKRRPPPQKRRPVQFNPFLAAQRVLPHNPRPIRGLHNNLPVRPPRPHPAHHLRRPNINTIPSNPTKAPTAVNKPGKSVAALIAENEHFSTLHTALKAAGMMENLAGAGPFTVFAPTNAAFDKVPVDSLNKLMANKEELKKVLERHIVPGVRMEGHQIGDGSIKHVSASGDELRTEREKFVKVHTPVGSAFVVKFDFLGSNGVYHAIDQVL